MAEYNPFSESRDDRSPSKDPEVNAQWNKQQSEWTAAYEEKLRLKKLEENLKNKIPISDADSVWLKEARKKRANVEREAIIARAKYLKNFYRDMGKHAADSTPGNLGFGKPGEAGTDEDDPGYDPSEAIHNDIQIVGPPQEEKLKEQLKRKLKRSEKESTDPEWVEKETDPWEVVSPVVTKGNLPPYYDNEHPRSQKERGTEVDMGPINPFKKTENLTMTPKDLAEEDSKRRLWHNPPDPDQAEQPGWPEKIIEAERNKQSNRRRR